MLLALFLVFAIGTAEWAEARQFRTREGKQLHMVSSEPRNDQVLHQSPARIVINFSKQISSGSFKVTDNYGSDLTDGKVDVKGKSMSASLRSLSSGRYTVRWRASCSCSDPDASDSFSFTVQ